ncbi:MFS transporter [Streptomyces triticagri]|uniref:MFS transporter n=1 Tax=Streptomyces triticagri TaxID=2293568 RepID=A0A372M314_9ACTN|nr:MFS transporter [Streptomyces triticagri]RFU85209.1 MFS transporter [Streptomyces triticagri]
MTARSTAARATSARSTAAHDADSTPAAGKDPRAAAETPDGDRRLGGPFWRLWSTTFVTSCGDGLRLAAMPMVAALFTRDPMLLSLVTFAGQLPWVLAGAFAGAFVDRHDQQRVMLWSDASRAVLAVLFTAALLTGWAGIGLLIAFALTMGVVETLRDSATIAIVPRLVPHTALDKANSLLQGAAMLCVELAGPPLAALLLVSHTSWPFALNAVAFTVAALLLPGLAGVARPMPKRGGSTLTADVADGIRWLWRHRLLRSVCALVGIFNFALSSVVAIAVVYAYEVLGVSSVGYGLLMAVIAVGGVAGVALAAPLAARLGRERTVLLCCGVAPVAFATAGSVSHPLLAAGALAPVGMALAVITIVTTSLRQVLVPAELLGRVSSSYRLIAVGMSPLGALTGGAVASAVGLRGPFFLAAAVLTAAWLCALGPLRAGPASRTAEDLTATDAAAPTSDATTAPTITDSADDTDTGATAPGKPWTGER